MLEYIRDYYKVPAEIGRGVVVDGQPGVIVEDMGNHIGVLFDKDKPGNVLPCHPTWKVDYGDMRPIRKPTRSQRRYRRYLQVSECYDSFMHFLRCHKEDRPNG